MRSLPARTASTTQWPSTIVKPPPRSACAIAASALFVTNVGVNESLLGFPSRHGRHSAVALMPVNWMTW